VERGTIGLRSAQGGLNSRVHAIRDGQGRPLMMLLSEGQVIDFKGAASMMDALRRANTLRGDRGQDDDWLRQALSDRGLRPCFRSMTDRSVNIPRDALLYRKRRKNEVMLARLRANAVHYVSNDGFCCV
jgi:transposase